MAVNIQAIRGMHDVLTDQTPHWQYLERMIQDILQRYAYQEIRLPILEKTELFERCIGELTDIVSKEMYTFEDRNGDRLTLRPEATAGCVRAGLQHGLFNNSTPRLWYMGPMFRHERPQKGRLRQFHQIGVEAYGMAGPDIDAEIIMLSARIWAELGLKNIHLQINTLGTAESRRHYREILIEYFQDNLGALDDDSRTRLERNPLRILDSKNADMQSLIAAAPGLDEYLDDESAHHFATLQQLLNASGLDFEINLRLVRGLDYYSKTVFEWVTDRLGAQGTVCAGGRYDGLIGHFGGKPSPAIGFAIGLERLLALVATENPGKDIINQPHVYFIIAGDKALPVALRLAEDLRNSLPSLRLLTHCGGGSFKSQFKKADKSGAELALIIGETELEKNTVGLKPLRQKAEQTEVPWQRLAEVLRQHLGL